MGGKFLRGIESEGFKGNNFENDRYRGKKGGGKNLVFFFIIRNGWGKGEDG